MSKKIMTMFVCIPIIFASPTSITKSPKTVEMSKKVVCDYDTYNEIGIKSTYKEVEKYIKKRDEQVSRYIQEEKERKKRVEEENKKITEKYYKKIEEEKKKEEQRKLEIKNNYQASRSGDDIVFAPHYNSQNLKELSNLTSNQIHKMLNGTKLECLADYYLAYEKEYGVNAIFLMSLNSLESGYGTSYLAKAHNNLGGYRNGDGSWTYFNSWHDCLKEIYKLIGQEYLSVNGRFHSGINIESVNSKYCPGSPQWTVQINSIARQYLNKLTK